MDLPSNPTPDQLDQIEKYLSAHRELLKKGQYGKKDHYQDREELMGSRLIIYRHSQSKSGVFYMRFYAGQGKYKVSSLRTTDPKTARLNAFDQWRKLENMIDDGTQIWVPSTQDAIDKYEDHLQKLVDTDQIKRLTASCKRTSLKKLRLLLEFSPKLNEIRTDVFSDYVTWRRTKNWDKKYHKNNPKPPTLQTINKELADFKGFFEWANDQGWVTSGIEYPFQKIDWSKSVEKNPAFELEHWIELVYYLRTWTKKKVNSKGNELKNPFYRQVFAEYFKILGNSAMRPHEALKLRWGDIQFKERVEVFSKGKEKERKRIIAYIQISHETKTGRRLVISRAGEYLKRLKELYRDKCGRRMGDEEFVFQNVGTIHSRADHFVGKPLSDHFLRKLWYDFIHEFETDKQTSFEKSYTLYSCRAFQINQLLEQGVPPAVVGDLVGHSIKTMEKFYKNIQIKNLEQDIVQVRRKKLSAADFQLLEVN